MAKKPLSPRKDSKQSRSKATVDVILQAATQILEKLDLDRMTTNKVAEKAGVSIGSYYQYFPNKEALIAKLIDREVNGYTAKLEELFAASAKDDLPALVARIVDDLCDQFLGRKTLARVFIKSTGYLKKTELVIDARNRIADQLTRVINESRSQENWTSLKSFVLINAVMGVLYSFALSQRKESEAELRRELNQMILNYLKP